LITKAWPKNRRKSP